MPSTGWAETARPLAQNSGAAPPEWLFDRYRVEERISARARYVRIEIRGPDCVRLVIPRFVSRADARAFLRSRAHWIERKVAELHQRQARSPAAAARGLRWDGQDRIPLRGIEHRLECQTGARKSARASLAGECIVLHLPVGTPTQSQSLNPVLLGFLKQQARNDALQWLDLEAPRLTVRVKGLRIADQRSLWGSCSAGGTISLNWRLVMAPPVVMRYVVIHELCHLHHHNHSAAFWRLVERQMPEFDQQRRWLRSHGAGLQAVLPRAD
ncbi:MAG: M48 family metallopeptidase [Panacagrimonas sp.]